VRIVGIVAGLRGGEGRPSDRPTRRGVDGVHDINLYSHDSGRLKCWWPVVAIAQVHADRDVVGHRVSALVMM
jgi:hypothetical protein